VLLEASSSPGLPSAAALSSSSNCTRSSPLAVAQRRHWGIRSCPRPACSFQFLACCSIAATETWSAPDASHVSIPVIGLHPTLRLSCSARAAALPHGGVKPLTCSGTHGKGDAGGRLTLLPRHSKDPCTPERWSCCVAELSWHHHHSHRAC
jgi:hypothetical protein